VGWGGPCLRGCTGLVLDARGARVLDVRRALLQLGTQRALTEVLRDCLHLGRVSVRRRRLAARLAGEVLLATRLSSRLVPSTQMIRGSTGMPRFH